MHTRTLALSLTHARLQAFSFIPRCRCAHATHTHMSRKSSTARRDGGPPQKWPSFFFYFFFLIVLPQVERGRGGKTWAKLLKIRSYRATAEVKQSESCRQSFNLKRTRSPWGARGAGRIKKFNNSMFYGPRKWDLSTGAGWGRREARRVVRTQAHKTARHETSGQPRSVELSSWPVLQDSSTEGASSVGGREDSKSSPEVSPGFLSFTPAVGNIHVFGIFLDLIFHLRPATFHSKVHSRCFKHCPSIGSRRKNVPATSMVHFNKTFCHFSPHVTESDADGNWSRFQAETNQEKEQSEKVKGMRQDS